jgi:hypothetical protein
MNFFGCFESLLLKVVLSGMCKILFSILTNLPVENANNCNDAMLVGENTYKKNNFLVYFKKYTRMKNETN